MDDVQVIGLTKRYGKVAAVDGLTFTARGGRVTGFLGRNGAGKTTTLRLLLGLARPTSGQALVTGRRYADLNHPLRTVGAVLDAPTFHPGRSARDHLRVLTTTAQLPAARISTALTMVGLAAVASRRVGTFSLGMRQRLAIAAAMLADPPVLILDEPANGLDPEGISWLRGFVRQRADEGRTVLVSSHQLVELSLIVDDVVIIESGRLVRQGPAAELTAAAGTAVRVRTPQLAGLRSALARRGMAAHERAPDLLMVPGATPESVGLAAADAGVVLYEMAVERTGLEALFLELTGQEVAR